MLKLKPPHTMRDGYTQQEELFDNAMDERASVSTKSRALPCEAIHELRMESFPVWYFSSVDASTSEIAHLLEILIRDFHERTETKNLLIPSVIELSLYFQCPEIQIMDAFELLRRKNLNLIADSNYAKVYITNLASNTSEDAVPQEDSVDWRDITHDFYTDVVQPVKHKLSTLFS